MNTFTSISELILCTLWGTQNPTLTQLLIFKLTVPLSDTLKDHIGRNWNIYILYLVNWIKTFYQYLSKVSQSALASVLFGSMRWNGDASFAESQKYLHFVMTATTLFKTKTLSLVNIHWFPLGPLQKCMKTNK